MGERISSAAKQSGLSPTDIGRVLTAYAIAMGPREVGPRAAASDQHPSFLHPGRTVLILLQDVEESDPRALALGALAESRDILWSVTDTDAALALQVFGEQGTEVLDWWRALPFPNWFGSDEEETATEEYTERLVTAAEPQQRIVLAEALDHLRHAHLWVDGSEQTRAADLASTVLGPVAERLHPTLGRRYEWWNRRVGSALR